MRGMRHLCEQVGALNSFLLAKQVALASVHRRYMPGLYTGLEPLDGS
jgi:hypothetical protein